MQLYVYELGDGVDPLGTSHKDIRQVLERVAGTTDTSDLVASLYLVSGRDDWKGFCKTGELSPSDFVRKSRNWWFTDIFPPPEALPEGYQLIRMMIGTECTYPADVSDVYGWRVRCQDFAGHLAYLFAHELHHFRRHHLGMHPGEGEQSACRWALARMVEVDIDVTGEKVSKKRRRPKPLTLSGRRRPRLLKKIKKDVRRLNVKDLESLQRYVNKRVRRARAGAPRTPEEAHMEKLRALPDGTELLITSDDDGTYTGQKAVKVRTMRRNSNRMVIRTSDGQEWRWPMLWLDEAE